ncbi:hypothetical protein ScPMuIL_004780 [Solemya velum]
MTEDSSTTPTPGNVAIELSEEISSKKRNRLDNKKKKAAAFLKLVQNNKEEMELSRKGRHILDTCMSVDSDEPPKKKICPSTEAEIVPEGDQSMDLDKEEVGNSLVREHKPRNEHKQMSPNELVEFRRLMKQRQKAAMQNPKFFLALEKMATYNNPLSDENHLQVPPMFLADLQHLILYGLQGNSARFKPRWCRLLRVGQVSSVVVVTLDSVSGQDFTHYPQCFPRLKELFDTSVDMVAPVQYGSSVPDDLFRVPVSKTQLLKMNIPGNKKKELMPLLKKDQFHQFNNAMVIGEKIPRTHLLLNFGQLVQENFPLPIQLGNSVYRGFVFSKDSYATVTPNSPLFAIDCEMCQTTLKKNEVCRVSVVNEKMETVYDTLIKPYNRIINYMTRFSGITKAMLDPVTTRLGAAQARLQEILPPDAILCGQSLNMDLMAMEMFHPYIIDTSVIYNLTGDRFFKTSLKRLTLSFLGRTIQESEKGHCSIEDAGATMELVLLKLKNGLEFGDVILGGIKALDSLPTTPKNTRNDSSSTTPNSDKKVIGSYNSGTEQQNREKTKTETETDSSKSIDLLNCAAPDSVNTETKGDENINILPEKNLQTGIPQNEAFFQKIGNFLSESLFEILKKCNKSGIVVSSETEQTASLEAMVTKTVDTDKDCQKAAKTEIEQKDFVYFHLTGFKDCLSKDPAEQDRKKALWKLDKRLWKITKHVRPNTVVCIVLPGRQEDKLIENAKTFVKVS